MTRDLEGRLEEQRDDESPPPRQRPAPGKSTLTSRLPPSPQSIARAVVQLSPDKSAAPPPPPAAAAEGPLLGPGAEPGALTIETALGLVQLLISPQIATPLKPPPLVGGALARGGVAVVVGGLLIEGIFRVANGMLDDIDAQVLSEMDKTAETTIRRAKKQRFVTQLENMLASGQITQEQYDEALLSEILPCTGPDEIAFWTSNQKSYLPGQKGKRKPAKQAMKGSASQYSGGVPMEWLHALALSLGGITAPGNLGAGTKEANYQMGRIEALVRLAEQSEIPYEYTGRFIMDRCSDRALRFEFKLTIKPKRDPKEKGHKPPPKEVTILEGSLDLQTTPPVPRGAENPFNGSFNVTPP